VKLLLATFGFGLLSSAVPVANIEAFLAAGTTQNAATWWALAGAATIGQMLGKVGFYLLGRQSLDWAWLRRRTEHGSGAKWWGRLNSMAEQRWEVTWLVVLFSAFVGFPPFAIVSVLAGQLKVPLLAFVVLGSAGRFARFATIVLGMESVLDWI
jgi:membrane protein YqaA with SNARE-associated domain